ncbi:MAG: 6-aminohexanoate hydrolase [Chloroflexi bacterium HGW-Chloroflexi-10]|nr:MAG: 6-aminohexanoate hydrolase [Chloroflexi bacterium HGW-Chloroflexi-10]
MKRDYWPTQEWRTAEPLSLGMHPIKLTDLDHRVKSQYRNINGIVVVRSGYIVFERYYNGFGSFDTHNVASVTKSFTSALIGIAIDAGFINSVDQKILDFFPEYIPGVNDIQKRTLTIRHLLTMTAPFAWKYKMGYEPLDRLRRQPDWVTYILNLLGQNGQIGKFQYCTAGTHLLSAIITRTTGLSAREFANDRLFRPLGMREIPDHEMGSFSLDNVFGKNVTGWGKDPNGYTTGGWGLTISPRDMVRFGFLYLNRGIWDGKQIISEAWIDESTALHSTESGYGYLWWLRRENNAFLFSALGSGGNVICCIPEKDLVVSIASSIISKPRDRWLLIEKCILPAIQN